ncbi:hypothetical protein [Psychromicrobium sp. YIM B11713]|uniref:hypothetical protein n=1 Tax=Psychromicrobium sp. YIM B11713 TaxID=3145233 RepID=UPI00374F0080
MPPRLAKTSAADIARVFDDLQQIVSLVSRVVAKYPYETLPERLKPFVGFRQISVVRPSSDPRSNELVIRAAAPFSDKQLRIPGDWLTMHQSQIIATVRKIYWDSKEETLRRKSDSLTRSIRSRNEQIERLQRALTKDRVERDRINRAVRHAKPCRTLPTSAH